MGDVGPVSYTHLDVYKRQLLDLAAPGIDTQPGNVEPLSLLTVPLNLGPPGGYCAKALGAPTMPARMPTSAVMQ